MSDAIYVVLRTANDTVETIGPAGAKFASFDEADTYARSLRDRYTFQSFIVCEALTAYETRMTGSVSRLGSEKPVARRKEKAVKDEEMATEAAAMLEDENVLQIHPRKVTAK